MGRIDRVNLVVKIVVFVNLIVIALFFLLENNLSTREILSKIGIFMFISGVILFLWNKCLWKIPILNKISNLPNIEGCWSGEIKNVLETDNIQKCTINIKQTFFDVKISVEVEKANSYTIVGDLLKVGDEWKLIWTWEGLNKENNFYGTTILNIKDKTLEGFYFTNFPFEYRNNELNCLCKCTSGSFKAKKVK